MKKHIVSIVGCLLLMAGSAFAQNSINLYTTGSTTQTSSTVAPGSAFSLDTYVTFTGFTGVGLSYWLQVPNALASSLTITTETYFTWTDPNQSGSGTTFTSTSGAPAGFMSENRDLGATSQTDPNDPSMFLEAKPSGTYQVSTLSFNLGSGIAPGTYQIQLQTANPHQSEISDTNFGSHNVGQSVYTITVVPEPSTWSLVILSGLGVAGLSTLRRRRIA